MEIDASSAAKNMTLVSWYNELLAQTGTTYVKLLPTAGDIIKKEIRTNTESVPGLRFSCELLNLLNHYTTWQRRGLSLKS